MVIIHTLYKHTHTQHTEHLVALSAMSVHNDDGWLFSALADVTLGEKKQTNTLFSCISPVLLLLFSYAHEQTLILPNIPTVCVSVSDAATRAEQPALLKCPSIHLTHTCTHTSYPRWRSSSQCHFQFGWDCSGGIMDWMMGGKRMMQLSCPATSVHISDPLTLQVASFTPHTSLHFF